MLRARIRRAAALVLALPLLAGCFGGRRGSDRREEATLLVHNNLAIASAATVYVVSLQGERHLLGSVTPRENASLRFRAPSISGSYRFVARLRRGSEIVSQPLALNGGETVDWELNNNTAIVLKP
ncbi:MAG TPA: hypothetical protein VF746_17850 [Longimicrobium sp.]|jgi:hypothetical protein